MPAIDTFKIDTYPPVGQAIVLTILDGSPPIPMVVTQNKVKSRIDAEGFVKGIVLKDGVYGEGPHAERVKAGTELQVLVAYGDEWRPFAKPNPRRRRTRNPSYEITVSPKFPAWNERPYTVRVWALTAAQATAKVRKQVKDGWVFPGGATYRTRKAQDED